jgi:hypothetical protein
MTLARSSAASVSRALARHARSSMSVGEGACWREAAAAAIRVLVRFERPAMLGENRVERASALGCPPWHEWKVSR